jgi:uncharacterized protein YdiU (UPF0061 family)
MTVKNMTVNKGWRLDNSYTRLPDIFYSRVKPEPVRSPGMVILNQPLAASLGLNPDYLESKEGIEILAGNHLPEGSIPISQAYAGHQFGYFTMLGDGRAVLLGEQITPRGDRYDIQLKGSGRTPYSRGGDGRAALGPMLREYIISEAMNALGIPTTRSLAVVLTGEPVFRETILPGAVLTRTAASHIRVGTFQYISRWGTTDQLRLLADYTWEKHFSGRVEEEENDGRYLSLLKEVIRQQAFLIAKWQMAGFIHGVMNTDNMAVSGETIDYGPCAFMDVYDPKTVFSSIDTVGRYAYGNQPKMAEWNLRRFAEALRPLIRDNKEQAEELTRDAVSDFHKRFHAYWLSGMRGKLGILNEEEKDEVLINELLKIMKKYGADYTNTFRSLTIGKFEDTAFFDSGEFSAWHHTWKTRIQRQQESEDDSSRIMRENNPSVIPRNHRVEEALDSAAKENDLSVMDRLLKVLSDPFSYSREQDEYSLLPKAANCRYWTFCGT